MNHGDPCLCVLTGSTLRSIGPNCNQEENVMIDEEKSDDVNNEDQTSNGVVQATSSDEAGDANEDAGETDADDGVIDIDDDAGDDEDDDEDGEEDDGEDEDEK